MNGERKSHKASMRTIPVQPGISEDVQGGQGVDLFPDPGAGKSPNAREDIWLAELHATYAELQYLRDIQMIVANLRIEVQKLRDEVEQMK